MKHKSKLRCECGLLLLVDSGSHKTSVYHRQHKRIERLLAKPCVDFAEIGRRVGVSRERVRQIYTNILERGRGMERRSICAIAAAPARQKAKEAARQRKIESLPRIKSARTECAKHGLAIEIVDRYEITVNGQRVALRGLFNRHGYLATNRLTESTCAGMDFIAYYGTGHWLIMPMKVAPAKATAFSNNHPTTGRPGAKFVRHDYRNYLDAWHLLAK